MKSKENAYEQIYQDLLLRMYEGEFPLGSSMPSLSSLCEQYNVGKNTVIRAMGKLKDDGFVTCSQGKAAIATFDYRTISDADSLPGMPLNLKIPLDYYYAILVLFPAIYSHATYACGDAQRKELADIIDLLPWDIAQSEDFIYLSIRFINVISSLIDNKLILFIVKRIMKTLVLPATLFYGRGEPVKSIFLEGADILRAIYAAVGQNNRDRLEIRWRHFIILIQSLIKQAIDNHPLPEADMHMEDELFETTEEFKYFIIAVDLHKKIKMGEYKKIPLGIGGLAATCPRLPILRSIIMYPLLPCGVHTKFLTK